MVLDSIPMVDQDGDFERLMSELQLKKQAADTPEIQALLQAQARDPDNMDTGYQLAVQFSQAGRSREALELLIGILRRDREFRGGEARKTLLDIIRALGKGEKRYDNPAYKRYIRRFELAQLVAGKGRATRWENVKIRRGTPKAR